MRNLRRLPIFLRVVWITGLLFPFASLGIILAANSVASAPSIPGDVARQRLVSDRWYFIALNLILLSLACTVAVSGYNARLRRWRQGPFLLDTWQKQTRAIASLAALPLGAIALAAVIPSTQDVTNLITAISVLGAGAFMLASVLLVSLRGV